MKKQKKDFIDKKEYQDEKNESDNNENYLEMSMIKDIPAKSLSELEKDYYETFQSNNSN